MCFNLNVLSAAHVYIYLRIDYLRLDHLSESSSLEKTEPLSVAIGCL